MHWIKASQCYEIIYIWVNNQCQSKKFKCIVHGSKRSQNSTLQWISAMNLKESTHWIKMSQTMTQNEVKWIKAMNQYKSVQWFKWVESKWCMCWTKTTWWMELKRVEAMNQTARECSDANETIHWFSLFMHWNKMI